MIQKLDSNRKENVLINTDTIICLSFTKQHTLDNKILKNKSV